MRWISIFITRPLMFFVLACTLAFAQSNESGPLLLAKPAKPERVLAKAESNLRINVNLTLVPVTVLDPVGRSVTGLTTRNFRLYDNSHQVPIASFGLQDQPVTVGLVFDCSRSMSNKFRNEREAPRQLFRQLAPGDESFLVTVSNKAELRFPLTADLDSMANALLFTHPGGTTALRELKKSHLPRKALVVVSDGGENNSRYTLHEIDQLATEADAQIFTVLVYKDPQEAEELHGPTLLEHLAQRSGGVDFVFQDVRQIRQAMARIGTNLHSQYLLGYYAPGDSHSGQYRKIAVQLLVPVGTPRLLVRARAGYYAP